MIHYVNPACLSTGSPWSELQLRSRHPYVHSPNYQIPRFRSLTQLSALSSQNAKTWMNHKNEPESGWEWRMKTILAYISSQWGNELIQLIISFSKSWYYWIQLRDHLPTNWRKLVSFSTRFLYRGSLQVITRTALRSIWLCTLELVQVNKSSGSSSMSFMVSRKIIRLENYSTPP